MRVLMRPRPMGRETTSGRVCILAVALVGWLALGGACGGDRRDGRPRSEAPARLARYALTIGDMALQVEVAATREERRRGLSGRWEVPSGTGMLFVFPDEARRTFWMKDTLTALSVAFLDEEGLVTQMEDMTPLSETPHTSREPARYVLEVPRGWFQEVGIEVGDRTVFGDALERRLGELDLDD